MQRTTLFASLVAGLVAASAPAQTHNVLIPSGSIDGAFGLIDKDADGTFTTQGEVWDYIRAVVNTSPRNYVMVGTKIFFSDTGRDQIVWIEDSNADGKIDAATERHVYYDVNAGVGGLTPGFVTVGPNDWIWWVNDGGTGEGVYKSKDMNADGDAEDAGETIPVLTETMPKVNIENTPNTTAAIAATRQLSTTELDSIIYDPTYGPHGRFILEDEWSDQTICLEDANNDGDFNDPGECYLFCGLYDGARTTRIDADVNPDVTAGLLPVANEIRNHAIDTTTSPTTYYLMSGDTGAANLDACMIFKGQDANADGDINDAGETTIFFDGSLDSTGAINTYNFTLGIASDATAGIVYANAELDGAPDEEHLIRLQDNNSDGDANDAGELTVLFNLGVDRTHYTPSLFPAGTLSPLSVQTTMAEIRYYGAASCASSSGTHNIQYGTSSATHGRAASQQPEIGNAGWLVRTWGAAQSQPGTYFVGVSKIAAGIPLDPAATCNVYHTFDADVYPFTTDATGLADTIISIPNNVALLGLWTYWQSVVVDAGAAAGLGITLSDAFEAKVGDWGVTK